MQNVSSKTFGQILLLTVILLHALALPSSAHAYIGPGAGFAFLGSAFVFITTILLAALTLLFWPFQIIWRVLRRKGISKNAKTRRIVILGLDGMDPKLMDRYMSEGILPNFKRLAETGSYRRLATTLPSISPVAWSSFQTGVNPGAHNIFDFLSRDKRTNMPSLASTETTPPSRFIKFLKWQVPLGGAKIRLLRKSQPFWRILGDRGILCNVLRVPITYPPDDFNGNILSAMCAPDLKGTQGCYSLFTSSPSRAREMHTGGTVMLVERRKTGVSGEIEGPPDPFRCDNKPLRIPFLVDLSGKQAVLKIQKQVIPLPLNEFTGWVELKFRTSLRKTVTGICRFCLRSVDTEFLLYVSPINISPSRPALPISSPSCFATYLAKTQGNFGTLGLLEDTWALNNNAIDERLFLKLTWLAHEERESMFFEMIDKTREGLVVCVFDASDRIQHMFWRQLEENRTRPDNEDSDAIPRMYRRMDELLGNTLSKLGERDVLIVMSDHGFNAFRRCVNINTWLKQHGLLHLRDGKSGTADYFQDVDWTKTKAFGLGLGGIYLNRLGREALGVVTEEEVADLKKEISEKLARLIDPLTGEEAVHAVYDTAVHYHGMYADDAPDLIVGCRSGYRVAWESVTGKLRASVIEDNDKAWSGDHCIDPSLVPGILFINRPSAREEAHIMDIAPTALSLFDVPVPAYMDGKSLLE